MGLIDADLGGGVIKQRVARTGKGRSGGYRTVIAYRRAEKAFFVYGFAKKEKENLGPDELKTAKEIAEIWLPANAHRITVGLEEGELEEVDCGSKENKPDGGSAS